MAHSRKFISKKTERFAFPFEQEMIRDGRIQVLAEPIFSREWQNKKGTNVYANACFYHLGGVIVYDLYGHAEDRGAVITALHETPEGLTSLIQALGFESKMPEGGE